MAERLFIFMNPTYGYHEEQDLTVDTATLLGLTMGGDIGMAGNEVTGLPAIPSGGTAATSKTYVDNIASNIKWKPPVVVLDMISDADQAGVDPAAPDTGDAYVVNNWSTQTDGDIVEWDVVAVVAERLFIFMNPTYGYHEEQDLTVDTATLLGLTMGGDIGMAGNEVTGLPAIPSGGTAATSKTYVDNIASNIKWKPPVVVLDMISDADQAGVDPAAPDTGDAYVVNNWSTQTDGDIVEWDGDSWEVIVANSGGVPPEGVRVGVADTSAAGSFTGQEADIATYNVSAASWSFEQPEDGWSVMVSGDDGVWEHNAFTYDLAGVQWILFSGAGQVVAGDGLTKSGNQIDVGAGNGIEVGADIVSVNLYSIDPGLEFNPSTGELLVMVDGAHGLILGSSGVEIELDETPDTLDVDAAGLKVVGLPSLFKVNDVAVGETYNQKMDGLLWSLVMMECGNIMPSHTTLLVYSGFCSLELGRLWPVTVLPRAATK